MNFSDQQKIFDPKTWGWPVHLIGAGGINNLVGPVLAKMGIDEIHVWDDDILDDRNCPTEVAYSVKAVGQPKTAAMADAIRYLVGDAVTVVQHQERVTEQTELKPGVVVCGVDSMKSRKEIWQNIKANSIDIPLFIDGRSAGEEIAIFAFAPVDFEAADNYETWLYDDEEALQLECGARNIGYIAAYMAAEIPRIITRFHRGLPIEFIVQRDAAEKIRR